MTSETVPERAPSPDDLRAHAHHRQQAGVVARIMDSAERICTDTPDVRPNRLALLIADAHLLTRLLGNGWGREDCEAIADRLGTSGLTRNILGRVEELEAQLDAMAVEVVTKKVRVIGTANPFDDDERLVPSIVLSAEGSATINLSSGSDDRPHVRLTAGFEAGEVLVAADLGDDAPIGMLCAAAGIGEDDRGQTTLTFGDVSHVVEVAAWSHDDVEVSA